MLLVYVQKVHGNVTLEDELYCSSSVIMNFVVHCKLYFIHKAATG
jgi:hypothetical protein